MSEGKDGPAAWPPAKWSETGENWKQMMRKSGTGRARSTHIQDNNSGTYISSMGRFRVAVPLGWGVTEEADLTQILSSSASTAVTISTWLHKGSEASLDPGEHLQRFLAGVKSAGRPQTQDAPGRAIAEYVDTSGSFWKVAFVVKDDVLLLVTCNTSAAPERPIGFEVTDTVEVMASGRAPDEAGGPGQRR